LIDYFSTKQSVDSNRILYTPSNFARDFLIYLQETGRLRAIAPHSSNREGLQSFLCFVVLDGAGKLYYDGREYSMEETQGVRCKLKFYKLNEMSCTMFDYVVKSVNNDMEMLR